MSTSGWVRCNGFRASAASPWVASSAAAIGLVVASGCTLIGTGVGAGVSYAVPGPYEEQSSSVHGYSRARYQTETQLQPGEHIRVKFEPKSMIVGDYVGVTRPKSPLDEGKLVVELDSGEWVRVPLERVRAIEVDTGGNGWLIGGAIGLVVDLAVVLTLTDARGAL